MGVKISANQGLSGLELAEAKRMEKLEKIRAAKKASKTKGNGLRVTKVSGNNEPKAVKPKLEGLELAEAKRMEKLEKIRKAKKAAKSKSTGTSITDKQKRTQTTKKSAVRKRSSLDKLEKLQLGFGPDKKAADDKKFDALLKRIKSKLNTVKKNKNPSLYENLMDQLRNINRGKVDNKNMGGMMKKKSMGYMSGGQSKLDKNKDGKISGADFKMMNKGGMSKKGKSGYMYGGMTKSKKK